MTELHADSMGVCVLFKFEYKAVAARRQSAQYTDLACAREESVLIWAGSEDLRVAVVLQEVIDRLIAETLTAMREVQILASGLSLVSLEMGSDRLRCQHPRPQKGIEGMQLAVGIHLFLEINVGWGRVD